MPFKRVRPARLDIALVAVAACVATSSAQADTLYEAMAKAYSTNPTLEAARAQLRATDEGVPQVLSEWRPSVFGTAQGGHEWDSQNKPIRLDQETNPRSYGVTVQQPIFDGFGTVAGTSQAENLVQSGRVQLTEHGTDGPAQRGHGLHERGARRRRARPQPQQREGAAARSSRRRRRASKSAN